MGILDIFHVSRIKAERDHLQEEVSDLQQKNSNLKQESDSLRLSVSAFQQEVSDLQQKLDSLGFNEYSEVQSAITLLRQEIEDNNVAIARQRNQLSNLQEENAQASKQLETQKKKISRARGIFDSINYSIKRYQDPSSDLRDLRADPVSSDTLEEFSPSVILKLHCMDVKSLRKAYKDNDKQINKVLDQYAARYILKSNRAIYQLMVIALRAELQNVLSSLKYEALDEAETQVKNITAKYLRIAGDGNQSIAGTLTRFIGEIEYLFLNAVKIEYNYYVKKEQARQEQAALREQMRQEAAERKALEQERKRVEREEEKFNNEIARVAAQLQQASEAEAEKLRAQILSLQASLSDITIKKDEITSLQNGKAGNVYIISNLGSFGENVFKIGMTRRLDPQERIDELGSASVPFKFDVHSFIFSENAVELENALHDKLNSHRVNKVNLRKEFFYSSIDELEELVGEIDPTAEFNRTMIAEEFRQSQSSDTVYTSDYSSSSDSEDDD